ncbi:MAG: PQQ-binding-like beta-propeller repeat protein [Acidobacteria bacterium]|nr:PQQ-binding-like beta-propeller repeat protein [Acidobacteriota bacterium]
MLLAFGLQLPAVPPSTPPAGQSVPPPVTRPAPTGPWASAWSRPIESPTDLLLSASGDFVFIAGPETALEARSAATGDVAWRHANSSWQAIAAIGTLVLGVSGEHAYALDAATGRTRWVTETTGPNTRLTVDTRHVLLISDNDLLLREVESGTPLWRAGLTAPPAAPAAFGADLVVVGQQDGAVLVFDRTSGALRWQTKLTSAARALTAEAPVVYAGLASGAFCALNDRNGSERWCFPLRVPTAGPAVVDGELVRLALLDNSLRSFHRLNGAMAQPVSLGHRPAGGPALTGAFLVVALTSGEFVMIDRASARTTRLQVPGAEASHLMERSAISPDGQLLVSLAIAPGGERRLSAYRPRPAVALPILASLPAGPFVALPPPPVTAAGRPPVPRPFPGAR